MPRPSPSDAMSHPTPTVPRQPPGTAMAVTPRGGRDSTRQLSVAAMVAPAAPPAHPHLLQEPLPSGSGQERPPGPPRFHHRHQHGNTGTLRHHRSPGHRAGAGTGTAAAAPARSPQPALGSWSSEPRGPAAAGAWAV